MSNLDCINACFIEGPRDFDHMRDAVLMADRMHSVTQGDVLNIQRINTGARIRRLAFQVYGMRSSPPS